MYWHYPHNSNQVERPASAVWKGNFKLIRFHEDDRLELYDLKKDIGEQRDLSNTLPDKTNELSALLSRWLKSVDAAMPSSNPKFDRTREGEGSWWKEPNAFDRWGRPK